MRTLHFPSLMSLVVLCGVLQLLSGCESDDLGAPASIVVTETNTMISIRAGQQLAQVQKSPFHLSLSPVPGVEVDEAEPGLFFVTGGARLSVDRIESFQSTSSAVELAGTSAAGDVRIEISFPYDDVIRVALTPPAAAAATAAGARLASPATERIYGLIERTVSDIGASEFIPMEVGSLDRRGTAVSMQVFPTISLYTPFFQTSRGYGLFVEGTTIGRYDLALADPSVLELEFELPPGVGRFSFLCLGGPTHDALVERYTSITGRPFVPPEWAFKHWRWRDEHRLAPPALLDGVAMNADIVDDISHYEQLQIPIGNYTIDRPWGTNDLPDLTLPEQPGFGDLVWDETRFPNPQRMIDAFTQRGYHLFLWVAPWATGITTNREAQERGYLAPRSRYIIDFTNPDAVSWWAEKIAPLIHMGIAGLKLDRGEEDTPSAATDVYFDGRTGREIRNAYPEIMARVHHDILAGIRGDDFLVYPRTGYAGSQQWVIFSAGDVPGKDILGRPTDLGLRAAILAQLHNAFNGFPIWGSDTGGYEEFGDREVFARWLEFSAFSPIMEIGGVGTHAPWDMPTEPRYDTEMIDIYRDYTTLHHALIPYTYRHALEAGRSGRPIAKPLVFNYPNDERVSDLWEEFLYGDDILVAPVWRVGQRRQAVYLPEGRWVDYWNRDRVLDGPVDLDESVPLDRIPIFIREGADVLDTL